MGASEIHRHATYAAAQTWRALWIHTPRKVATADGASERGPCNRTTEYPVSIVAYVILGFFAGATAIRVLSGTGAGTFEKIAVGIIGAVVAGALYDALVAPVSSGVTIDRLLVATVGSVVALIADHAVIRCDSRTE